MVKPVDDLLIETGDVEDVPALFALQGAAIHGLAARDYSPAQLAAWAPPDRAGGGFAERLAGTTILVAWRGSALAGFANLTADGLVDFLFVHPEAAGRGIGASLLGAVIDAGRARGLARLAAHVSLTARSTFERQGFQVEAAQKVQVRGEVLTNFRMHLDL